MQNKKQKLTEEQLTDVLLKIYHNPDSDEKSFVADILTLIDHQSRALYPNQLTPEAVTEIIAGIMKYHDNADQAHGYSHGLYDAREAIKAAITEKDPFGPVTLTEQDKTDLSFLKPKADPIWEAQKEDAETKFKEWFPNPTEWQELTECTFDEHALVEYAYIRKHLNDWVQPPRASAIGRLDQIKRLFEGTEGYYVIVRLSVNNFPPIPNGINWEEQVL